jgi:hypothetical protein
MCHSLDRECELEEIAIQRRVALSPWLLDKLDIAVFTGDLPCQAEMLPHVAASDQEGYVPSDWDGLIDGEPLDFAEAMRWCTLRQFYGWGFPCKEALILVSEICRDSGRLIDFGSGTGYWSAVLRARGIDVIAVDTGVGRWARQWTGILKQDGVAAIRDNPGVPVLISWADSKLSGKDVLDAMEPARVILRCGPRAVTSKTLAALLPTHFDIIAQAPVMCCSGAADDLLEALVRRAVPFQNDDERPEPVAGRSSKKCIAPYT